jgi:hypothetical protein
MDIFLHDGNFNKFYSHFRTLYHKSFGKLTPADRNDIEHVYNLLDSYSFDPEMRDSLSTDISTIREAVYKVISKTVLSKVVSAC